MLPESSLGETRAHSELDPIALGHADTHLAQTLMPEELKPSQQALGVFGATHHETIPTTEQEFSPEEAAQLRHALLEIQTHIRTETPHQDIAERWQNIRIILCAALLTAASSLGVAEVTTEYRKEHRRSPDTTFWSFIRKTVVGAEPQSPQHASMTAVSPDAQKKSRAENIPEVQFERMTNAAVSELVHSHLFKPGAHIGSADILIEIENAVQRQIKPLNLVSTEAASQELSDLVRARLTEHFVKHANLDTFTRTEILDQIDDATRTPEDIQASSAFEAALRVDDHGRTAVAVLRYTASRHPSDTPNDRLALAHRLRGLTAIPSALVHEVRQDTALCTALILSLQIAKEESTIAIRSLQEEIKNRKNDALEDFLPLALAAQREAIGERLRLHRLIEQLVPHL